MKNATLSDPPQNLQEVYERLSGLWNFVPEGSKRGVQNAVGMSAVYTLHGMVTGKYFVPTDAEAHLSRVRLLQSRGLIGESGTISPVVQGAVHLLLVRDPKGLSVSLRKPEQVSTGWRLVEQASRFVRSPLVAPTALAA